MCIIYFEPAHPALKSPFFAKEATWRVEFHMLAHPTSASFNNNFLDDQQEEKVKTRCQENAEEF